MGKPPLYTIGYGAREIEAFIAVLRTYEIDYLIDIRSRPYSRYKPDFSKQPLAAHLQAAGIRYVFMGDTLGGQPDDPACYTDGKVDYEKVKQQGFYEQGLERLREAERQGLRVALMCSEGKPEQCHRSKLIGKSLSGEGLAVAHIDENDQIASQDEVIGRLHGGQRAFDFREEYVNYTSRKRYSQENDET
jgi:uncharacterized protein (DUF488 family)